MKDSNKSAVRKQVLFTCNVIVLLAVIAMLVTIVYKNPDAASDILSAVFIVIGGLAVITAISILERDRQREAKAVEALEDLMHQINSMVILWDTEFEYIRVNDAFIKATGYSSEDVKNKTVLKKLLPEDAFSENLQSIVNNRDEEFFIKAKDGSSVCTVWSTSIVHSYSSRYESRTIMMSIGPDLTEINKMRQDIVSYSDKLAESQKKYALSMDLSEIGLLLKETGSSRYYVSNILCDMLGIEAENGYVDGDAIREVFHPKDRVVFDTFSSGMKNASEGLDRDEIHSVDFRAKHIDGTYHWYNFRYKSVTGHENAGSSLSVGGAVMDITQDKEKDLMIERMAYVDEVTGIFNRNKFMIMGNEILSCAKSDSSIDYWVIVLDIDNFHLINDTCGYSNGNHLLREIAAVLTSNLTEGGFTARIGGDNFALLIRAAIDEELPVRFIKRIQQDISQIGGKGLEAQNISCSAGYCRMSDGGLDFAQVLDHAEFALSLSDGTRNSILRFDNSAHDAIITSNEIEKDLSRAIDNNELVLYYQPKINLENGKIMGMEALIRWIKADGTVVPPGEFIPIAEHSMLITKISKYVLYEACRQNKEWQDMGLEPVTVSINLTAMDFYQTNVTESIHKALAETGLEPRWLDVELTESLALKDIDHAVQQMKELKELGVKLSMDDFGTGYSSLSYIQILPITILKLDRSFIMYLEEDEISREIVSAVIRIAKSKKIETIAEGIETQGQAEILKKSGCDQAQGYFFGKPMPAKQFEKFLRSRQFVRV